MSDSKGTPKGSEARRIAATLLHDVGKYVARTTRNVRDPSSIPEPLARMMVKDVYETYRGRRASERFEELAAELAAVGLEGDRLATARAALARIDALEPGARAGDRASLADIARDAIVVEDALRSLVRELAEKEGGPR